MPVHKAIFHNIPGIASCGLPLAVARLAWSNLPVLTFDQQEPLESWPGVREQAATVKDSMEYTRRLIKVSGLVMLPELEVIQDFLGKHRKWNIGRDSVDRMPAYEFYAMHVNMGGYRFNSDTVFRTIVEERIQPYVRDRYACPQCSVCQILCRRYFEKERTSHPLHHDKNAYITAVLAINPEEYVGGLYVQPSDSRSTRFLQLHKADLVVHQYDLNHGVEVKSGFRFSVVFWFADTDRECHEKTHRWYQQKAESGDAVAQFGYASAFSGKGNFKQAMIWLSKSANLGYKSAQRRLGYIFQNGEVGTEKNLSLASWYYLQAADQDDAMASLELGLMYLGFLPHGGGFVALDLLRRAATAAAKGESKIQELARQGIKNLSARMVREKTKGVIMKVNNLHLNKAVSLFLSHAGHELVMCTVGAGTQKKIKTFAGERWLARALPGPNPWGMVLNEYVTTSEAEQQHTINPMREEL